MYEYGNARVAALRSRLLDEATLRRLGELGSAEAVLVTLERSEGWRAALRQAAPLFGDATAAIEAAVERHRTARLGALPDRYEGSARRLVEALVLGLDLERVIGIVRRRRGGAAPDVIGASIVRGALLDATTLGEIARAGDAAGIGRILVNAAVLPVPAGSHLAGSAPTGASAEEEGRLLEERIVRAFDAARLARAEGRGAGERMVRTLLEEEIADRDTVALALREAGPSAAWLVERTGSLERLDRIARAGPRDPLGIGAVAGYVAAVESEAIRVRAALARVVAGWGSETMAPFLAGSRS